MLYEWSIRDMFATCWYKPSSSPLLSQFRFSRRFRWGASLRNLIITSFFFFFFFFFLYSILFRLVLRTTDLRFVGSTGFLLRWISLSVLFFLYRYFRQIVPIIFSSSFFLPHSFFQRIYIVTFFLIIRLDDDYDYNMTMLRYEINCVNISFS